MSCGFGFVCTTHKVSEEEPASLCPGALLPSVNGAAAGAFSLCELKDGIRSETSSPTIFRNTPVYVSLLARCRRSSRASVREQCAFNVPVKAEEDLLRYRALIKTQTWYACD